MAKQAFKFLFTMSDGSVIEAETPPFNLLSGGDTYQDNIITVVGNQSTPDTLLVALVKQDDSTYKLDFQAASQSGAITVAINAIMKPWCDTLPTDNEPRFKLNNNSVSWINYQKIPLVRPDNKWHCYMIVWREVWVRQVVDGKNKNILVQNFRSAIDLGYLNGTDTYSVPSLVQTQWKQLLYQTDLVVNLQQFTPVVVDEWPDRIEWNGEFLYAVGNVRSLMLASPL